jgi:hypothetical protein
MSLGSFNAVMSIIELPPKSMAKTKLGQLGIQQLTN